MRVQLRAAAVKRLPIFLLAAAALTLGAMAEKAAAPALDKANMDLSVRPGDDFYRYANGNWIKNFVLPDDKSAYNSFHQVREQNRDRLHKLFETLAAQAAKARPGTPAQKIGDFYAVAMDVKAIDALGAKPLQEDLDRIAALSTREGMLDLVARFHACGFPLLFPAGVEVDLANSKAYAFYLSQGGIGLGDRDYYTKDDEDTKGLRTQYLAHIAAMLQLLGDSPEAAAKAARTVMDIEVRLARASKTNVENRDLPNLYNKMTPAQIQALCPEVDWTRYLQNIGCPAVDAFVVTAPKFYQELSALLKEVSLADWKTYLRWHLASLCSPYLSEPFVQENFRFFGQVMQGTKTIEDRWKRMSNLTSESLGELVGRIYVDKFFPPSSKKRMEELAANSKKAFEARLKKISWMGEATRQAALAKLATMRVDVGYPAKWEDYSSLEIKRDSFLANVKRVGTYNSKRDLARYGKPTDPEKWDMTPQTVNAGYNPVYNRMTFPAGILQPPFFFPEGDDAVVYGAIGMAIGHEMSHGFDDQGRNFDKDGNMKDWWTPEDAEKFKQLTQLLVDQYGGFTAVGDVKVNGQLSLGENIADFAGLTIAFDAYHLALAGKPAPAPIDGLTGDQRFFLANAQLWRGKIRDEALRRMVQQDVHPWGEFRVNGAPFNIPEFYKVFDIKEGDKLYRTPAQRPNLW